MAAEGWTDRGSLLKREVRGAAALTSLHHPQLPGLHSEAPPAQPGSDPLGLLGVLPMRTARGHRGHDGESRA